MITGPVTLTELERELAPHAIFCGRMLTPDKLQEIHDAIADEAFDYTDVRRFVAHWLKLHFANQAAEDFFFEGRRPLITGEWLRQCLRAQRERDFETAIEDDDADAEGCGA